MKKTFRMLALTLFVVMSIAVAAIGSSAAPLVGDINGDGEVNIRDAASILMIVTGHENVEVVEPCYHKDKVVIDEAVAMSCTADGKTAGVHCTECGEVLLAQVTIPTTGHTEIIIPAVPATCTETGLTEGKYCSVCKEDIVKQTRIDAPGHSESDWIIDKEPTVLEEGSKHKECTVCHAKTAEEVIPVKAFNGLAYSVNNDGKSCTVTGIGTYPDNDVVIPKMIDGYTVTAIGDKAFAELTNITSIVIPDTVITIGTQAFYGCTGITEITIPKWVSSIGTQIFYKADNLKTVYYNGSYSGASDNPFLSTPSIEKIVFGGSKIPSYACQNNTALKEVDIKETVKSIGSFAFDGCTSIIGIIIPDSVTSIGDRAFRGCIGLTSITIPNSVTSIATSTFLNCTRLTSITIPNSVTSIGYSAFKDCTGLTNINIPNSVISIDPFAFRNCIGLTSINIPSSVTSIGVGAFYDCKGLTNITIPASVTSIGSSNFEGTDKKVTVTFLGTKSEWENVYPYDNENIIVICSDDNRYTNAIDVLNDIFIKYNDNQPTNDTKLSNVAGGNINNFETCNLEGPAAFIALENSDLDQYLGIPVSEVSKIASAASMFNIINTNFFTCYTIQFADGTDIFASIDAIKENILARQWIMGAPEKLYIFTIPGNYVLVTWAEITYSEVFGRFAESIPDLIEEATLVVEHKIR